MLKKFLVISFAALNLGFCSVAFADNPASASIRFTTSPSTGPIQKGKLVRFRVVHTFASAVESGGACTVDLLACLTEFAPKGEGPADNTCDFTEVGSKTASAGESEVVFVTRAKAVRKLKNGAGRQLNFQTSSDCIDGSANQDIILSNPRARKVSDPSQRGVPPYKFLESLVDRFE